MSDEASSVFGMGLMNLVGRGGTIAGAFGQLTCVSLCRASTANWRSDDRSLVSASAAASAPALHIKCVLSHLRYVHGLSEGVGTRRRRTYNCVCLCSVHSYIYNRHATRMPASRRLVTYCCCIAIFRKLMKYLANALGRIQCSLRPARI